jgi:protoporphyrinogen oxidase
MKVIVFGAGISGLTTAYELLENGFEVTLIEKENEVGGMAKSKRTMTGVPTEHSWRGFAPFYKNTFELMERIGVSSNLSEPIEFFLLKDRIKSYKPGTSWLDWTIVIYYFLKYLLAGNRKYEYYKQNMNGMLKTKLSEDGYDFLIEFMSGPGYGMEKKDMSYGHYFKFPSLSTVYKQEYYRGIENDNFWHVTRMPTHEAWFEPWMAKMKQNGLKIIKNRSLKKLNFKDNKIISCTLDNAEIVTADDIVVCINPFDAENVFKTSNMNDLYIQHSKMNRETDSVQISFRLGFDKNIRFPSTNAAFVMPDSEYNITWYPQEHHWNADVPLDNTGKIKSLWSGTLIQTYNIGTLYGKKAIDLTNKELIKEIIYQITRSKSFQKMINENNGFGISEDDVIYSEIWNPENLKWVNNDKNEEFRPNQVTEFDNMFIAGSHTKTSTNIWSMESAVESGKIAAGLITKKYGKSSIYVYTHDDHWIVKFLQKIDNILYAINLPNLVDIIILLTIVFSVKLVSFT